MLYDVEPEIQDGIRALATTQSLFTGNPETVAVANPVDLSWYGTLVNPYRGAFCLVEEGAGFEDLVGEFLRFEIGGRSVTCYCLGESPEIPTPFAVTRRAWMVLDILPKESIQANMVKIV